MLTGNERVGRNGLKLLIYVLYLFFKSKKVTENRKRFVIGGLLRPKAGVLIKHTYGNTAFSDHTAAIGQFLTRNNPKKCGLTAAVTSDKTNKITLLNAERNVTEQQVISKALFERTCTE